MGPTRGEEGGRGKREGRKGRVVVKRDMGGTRNGKKEVRNGEGENGGRGGGREGKRRIERGGGKNEGRGMERE
jgi:ribonuclease E